MGLDSVGTAAASIFGTRRCRIDPLGEGDGTRVGDSPGAVLPMAETFPTGLVLGASLGALSGTFLDGNFPPGLLAAFTHSAPWLPSHASRRPPRGQGPELRYPE